MSGDKSYTDQAKEAMAAAGMPFTGKPFCTYALMVIANAACPLPVCIEARVLLQAVQGACFAGLVFRAPWRV